MGGIRVPRVEACDHTRQYLTDGSGWGHPAYERYEARRALGPLTDADLLAPPLLNVQPFDLGVYESLQAVRPQLQESLDQIRPAASVFDATDNEREHVRRMFALIDRRGIPGAKGTILSKVLHRKRPDLIPLWDGNVEKVYQYGETPRIPPVNGRSWGEFHLVFSDAVRADIEADPGFFEDVAALAVDPPISLLRAVDVVAWWAGDPKRWHRFRDSGPRSSAAVDSGTASMDVPRL
ncbi:hypothetical protein IN07_01370 [Modestobacter caceresii]|uniref:Uncharacterized protein n=1 Tax=Modestobacter caceresii TaxID=1522368 RepID=A0A098YDX3_9ACTN|nr:DUF6308 family protein [Modestobacter caceresii]KGH48637.1 hypothetical protein IN07_01370 [Modestobacter caceresii]